MTTSRLVKAITLLAVFAMAARISVDTDTWWHLRAGEWMIEHRQIIQEDHFSYTRAGASWNYPGWLVEIPMVWIYQLLGPGGLNIWTALMVTLAFGFVWSTLTGGPFLRAFVIILAAAASGVYWAARPYLITFLFAAIFLWILEDYRWSRKDRLLWLPAVMVVWANSHGGFITGFIFLGIYFIDRAISVTLDKYSNFRSRSDDDLRSQGAPVQEAALSVPRPEIDHQQSSRLGKYTFVICLTLLAVAINPSGPEMLLYPFRTVSIGALGDFIAEWQSPNFHELRVQPFLWLILLTLAAVGASRRRLAVSDFLLIGVFSSLGMMAARNIALFALVSPPVITRYAAPALLVWQKRFGIASPSMAKETSPRTIQVLNVIILVIVFLAAAVKAASVYPQSVNRAYFEETYPDGAIAFLKQHNPTGRLFNTYNWGGYLLWALPEYPVFIDGRTDLFDDELMSTWVEVIRGEADWESHLNTWGVNLLLLEPELPLAAQLREDGWPVLYEDQVSVLFERP